MTIGARIVSGLLLIVVVVSVAYLFNHQISGPDEFLMNGESFPAAQLPAMLAAFGKANLSSFQVDGNRIRVPHSQQSAYMALWPTPTRCRKTLATICCRRRTTITRLHRRAKRKR